MYNDDEELLLLAAALIVICGKDKKRKRIRRPLIQNPYSSPIYSNPDLNSIPKRRPQLTADLIRHSQLTFDSHLKDYLGISNSDFDTLVGKIAPITRKQDTNWKIAISVKQRLLVTLRFLATGETFTSMGQIFNISKQCISLIIPEVCDALVKILADEINLPETEEHWQTAANEFNTRYHFPHCVGVADGRHIAIQAPRQSPCEYINDKGLFSIVLYALVNADYRFTYFNIGSFSQMLDGENFVKTFINRRLNFPKPTPLIGREKPTPYMLLGNNTLPQSPELLTPYTEPHDDESLQGIFNYRLGRVQLISDNVFGVLGAKFKVLQRSLLLEPEKVKKVVCACIYLHNYLIGSSSSRESYTPADTFDYDDKSTGEVWLGSWRKEVIVENLVSLNNTEQIPSEEALKIQKEFAEFFQTPAGST